MNRHCKYILFSFLLGFFSVPLISFGQAGSDTLPAVPADTTPKPKVDTSAKQVPAPSPAKQEESHSVLQLTFIKEKVEHSPDSAFFNILKITNSNGKAVQGEVTISVPIGWKVISDVSTKVDIAPGSSAYIPIRVSLSRNVTGGVSYLINATLLSDRSLFPDKNQTSVSKPCYITIPEKTRWEVIPVTRTVYFDRYTEYAPFQLKLSNRGNGNKMVKLEFDIGSSLEMYGAFGRKYFTSLELKPNRDTVLTYNIKYKAPDESGVWGRDFKKLSIRIVATSDTITKKTSVNFKYLESEYTNVLAERISPLNIDVQLQNLLTDALPRLTAGAYGNIYFKNDHKMDYALRFPSIPFTGYDKPDFAEKLFWTNLRFHAHYVTERWQASIGDVGFPGISMIGGGGRGVSGSYKINKRNEVGGSFAASVRGTNYNGGVFHRIMLPKSIALASSFNFSLNDFNKMNVLSAAVQATLPIWPGHRVSLLVSGSQTSHLYNNQSFVDASGNPIITSDPGAVFYGVGGQLSYEMNLKKIRASLSSGYTSRHFSEYQSGQFSVYGNGQYTINKKYSLTGHSNFRIYNPLIYSQGLIRPYNKLMNGGYKVDFGNKLTKRLTLFAGPQFDHTFHEQLKQTSLGDTTFARFSSYSPRVAVRFNYKNHMNGSISPMFSLGRTIIVRAEDSTLATTTQISKTSYFNATAGINFMQNNWGLNVFYYYGPHSIATQTDFYFFNVYSKSLRVMPYFQKYFFNRTMLLKSYNSYHYDAAGNSERINLNATFSFFLERSWTFFVDNNMFLLSRISTEGDKIYSRSYYFSLGIRKSFDIPQPGIKYYDLKVVCFKDINGNGTLDEDEQGLSEIVIIIDRNARKDSLTKKTIRQKGQFVPAEMVTDNFGQVVYYRIPEGEFNVSVFPLMNLKDIFNVKGQKQTVTVTRDTTYYIPFVQTYRVNGNVIVKRDEYSSAGAVSVANIRITATDSLGNSFPALSAVDGSYAVYVPTAGKYKVSINNVFGELFSLQESDYEVSFDGAKEFHVDFIFNEKKRAMNVNTINSNTVAPAPVSTNTVQTNPNQVPTPPQPRDTTSSVNPVPNPADNGVTYKIQIGASATKIPASQFATRFKGAENIQEYVEGGVFKYTSGEFNTWEFEKATEYKDKLSALGYKDAFIAFFKNGKRIK